MLCEKCKVREANIKYTEIINGVKRSIISAPLCEGNGFWTVYGFVRRRIPAGKTAFRTFRVGGR